MKPQSNNHTHTHLPPTSTTTTPPKKSTTHKTLSLFGTLTMTLSLLTLYSSLLTVDWLTLQEPILDPTELEKLGPYDDDPKPHLLKAKLGLFKTCTFFKYEKDCVGFDWRRFLDRWELFEEAQQSAQAGGGRINRGESYYGGSELVVACVNRVRLTLPFILTSVLFTTLAFFSLIFGTFCTRNKKIIEASLLILAGLCQATALLTFVSQIGSEFESNNFYSQQATSSLLTTTPKLSSHYRYKYGYSFYLFLLSFSLSELAALFDMASYFKKQRSSEPPNNYQTPTETYGMESLTNTTGSDYNKHPDICEMNDYIIPQESYFINPEVVVVTNTGSYYGTGGRVGGKGQQKLTSLESFATMSRGRQQQMGGTNGGSGGGGVEFLNRL